MLPRTSFPRALLALAIGAVCGTCLTLFEAVSGIPVPALRVPLGALVYPPRNMVEILQLLEIVAMFAMGMYSVGLVIVGAPVWYVLHRLGKRTPVDAALTGATLTFFFCFVLDNDLLDRLQHLGRYPMSAYGWLMAGERAAWFAATGAIVGLTVWWVAYRAGSEPLP